MKAEIIAVGSEMLTPFRVDTNSLFLTDELNKLGFEVTRKTIVGDDREQLSEAFRGALERVPLVVSIGGLGPTEDDLTREVVAALLERKLLLNEDILRGIQERFRRYGRPMAENNARQALVPEGAIVLENKRGTAPGLWLEDGERLVILLPGPPPELKPMWRESAAPRLAQRARGTHLFARELRVAMMPESAVDQRVAPIYTQYSDVQTTILAAPGEIQLHLRCWTEDALHAEKVLNEMVERIVLALGESVFTVAGESLESVVAASLNQHHATLAVAESCTGGMVAQRLTSIAGSSSYFLGGVICYSNEIKSAWVDVPDELISAKGAVSAEVTILLAEGIRRRSGATLGLAITGVAGPGGGTQDKPVGTVHVALANASGSKERGYHFPGERELVRIQASQAALDMVRRYFLYAKQKT